MRAGRRRASCSGLARAVLWPPRMVAEDCRILQTCGIAGCVSPDASERAVRVMGEQGAHLLTRLVRVDQR